jgi:hypothetical protein
MKEVSLLEHQGDDLLSCLYSDDKILENSPHGDDNNDEPTSTQKHIYISRMHKTMSLFAYD